MLGNMMQEQLLISGVLEHAEKYNANTEIVSNTIEGRIHKYTCLLYTSPSPRDVRSSRMPSSA